MLAIKRVAEKLLTTIAGSAAFPLFTTLGGFTKVPEDTALLGIRDEIENVVNEGEDLVRLFEQFHGPNIKTETLYISILPLELGYPLYPGTFPWTIDEIVIDSTAKRGQLPQNQVIKVGALARMSLSSHKLNPRAKNMFINHPFDLKNPFSNNHAQAIEILHFLEEISYLLEKLHDCDLQHALGIKNPATILAAGSGQGVLEAPRGTLIHQVKLNENGEIADYNIIPPTQLNLRSLEHEVQKLLIKSEGQSPQEKTHLIEQLIRAFDPCITCAVH